MPEVRLPMHFRTAIVLAALLLPALQPARAQARYSAGLALNVGQPLGEFGDNVSSGVGLDGMGTLGLDSRGIFSLRAQLGWLQYSRKTESFLLPTGFGYLELESETKSGVLTLGVGPQLMAPAGSVRPYIAGTIGFSRFSTQTAINIPASSSNSGQQETLDEQTVSSDFLVSLAASAGIAFHLPIFGNTGAMADLGVRYHHNGLAKYVSSDGVQYNGTVTPTIIATTSEADFIVYRIGVVVPIR
jgi:hypothetical protein